MGFLLIKYCSSFSRVKSENGGEQLASTAMLELQKLGVVPRTVFLGPREGEARGRTLKLSDVVSPRPTGSRRASFSSVNGSQLADGLRRQLAAMGPPSSTSGTRSPRPPQHMSPPEFPISNEPVTLQRMSDSVTESKSILERERPHIPPSPMVSRPNSSMSTLAFARPPHGLGDAQKALPAIGSIRENAAGHLEHSAALRPRAPTISITSGRSSPVSTAHTIRAEQNMLRSCE